MRKNTNSFSNGNRSAKQVLGAGSRVGMAALIAASAASPAASAAVALMTSVWRARSRAKQTARYAGGRQPALQNHPPAGY